MKKYILLLAVLLLTACGNANEGNNKNEVNKNTNEEVEGLDLGKPRDVRNDKTGNWKHIVTPKKFDAETESLKYYNEYMQDGEIHYIVSFATNTTTVIRTHDGYLSVDVTEYVDKEEHDAATLGSGMLLASYLVYEDGEVEKVE